MCDVCQVPALCVCDSVVYLVHADTHMGPNGNRLKQKILIEVEKVMIIVSLIMMINYSVIDYDKCKHINAYRV